MKIKLEVMSVSKINIGLCDDNGKVMVTLRKEILPKAKEGEFYEMELRKVYK